MEEPTPGPRDHRGHTEPTEADAPGGLPQHLIGDLWGCPPHVLRDASLVRRVMLAAARESGATVVDQTFHQFDGGGLSGVVAVKESHLTVHTWPERGYAAIDVFLCGQLEPQRALALLATEFQAERTDVRTFVRGEGPSAAGTAAGGSSRGRSRRDMTVLYAVTLVVAMCSILYELLLAQTLSALLGNTVLRYSITIGCYLGALGVGALLCGRRTGNAGWRLTRIELGLSVLGGLAVPVLYLLDMLQRFVYLHVASGSMWETLAPILFLLASHGLIVAIGLLSGFEMPLLLDLGEQFRARSTNRVLGVDYLGALVGSVVFPLLLLRWLGLIAAGFAVGALNALMAFLVIMWRGERARFWPGVVATATAILLVGGMASSRQLEQYFLKKLYYAADMTDLRTLFAVQRDRPDIERHRSGYQTIDLVHDAGDSQWLYDLISTKRDADPQYPVDLWLYLDQQFQLFSGVDEVYHEWFVHAPVQAVGHAPRDVLVLGGGDGLTTREALKYESVRRLVQVEIDPVMLTLARTHPLLSRMNGGALDDPRVEIVQEDAFRWLRRSVERFDAVYIDMPAARDYNLSLVYSREFYALVRGRLRPEGFVAIDTPDGNCQTSPDLWAVYSNTLLAAGFETVVPMLGHVDADAPDVASAADTVALETQVDVPAPGGRQIRLSPDQARHYVRGMFHSTLDANVQEFTLAFPTARQVNVEWRDDLAVRTHLFNRWHAAAAFAVDCPVVHDHSRINSAMRPRLPQLRLLNVALP